MSGVIAYSNRASTGLGMGPGRMACIIFWKTFRIAPGMGLSRGLGPMAYQTIFAPFLVPKYYRKH